MRRTELSDEDADELMSADAIFYTVKKKTREPVYVVLEASWVVDEGDMERAIHRATILQRLGYPAVPVVAEQKSLRLSSKPPPKGA